MGVAKEQRKGDAETASQVTRILRERKLHGIEAVNELIPIVYTELRCIAEWRLANERPGQTLEATALVNEAYLRLVKDSTAHWENKRHFFVSAAEAMRRILIDNARRKNSQKRGGSWQRSEIDVCEIACDCPDEEIELIHEALEEFEKIDPQSAELVKLRFFAGLTQQQCADILGISKRTADNRWAFARAWLYRAIKEKT